MLNVVAAVLLTLLVGIAALWIGANLPAACSSIIHLRGFISGG